MKKLIAMVLAMMLMAGCAAIEGASTRLNTDQSKIFGGSQEGTTDTLTINSQGKEVRK